MVCHHWGWHRLKSVNCKHTLSICGARGEFITSYRKCLPSASLQKCPAWKYCTLLCFILWEIVFCIHLLLIEIHTFLRSFVRLSKGSDFRSIFKQTQKSREDYRSVKCEQCWIFYHVMYSHFKKTRMTFTPVWEVPSPLTQHSESLCLQSFLFQYISNALALIWLQEIKHLCVQEEASSGQTSFVIHCLDSVYSYYCTDFFFLLFLWFYMQWWQYSQHIQIIFS